MLIFPLKKEWYEKIRNGEKKIEYREVKPYWTVRLRKEYECLGATLVPMKIGEKTTFVMLPLECKLRLGYINKYLTVNITKIEVVDGKGTDLHIDKPVYAIYLVDVREE